MKWLTMLERCAKAITSLTLWKKRGTTTNTRSLKNALYAKMVLVMYRMEHLKALSVNGVMVRAFNRRVRENVGVNLLGFL